MAKKNTSKAASGKMTLMELARYKGSLRRLWWATDDGYVEPAAELQLLPGQSLREAMMGITDSRQGYFRKEALARAWAAQGKKPPVLRAPCKCPPPAATDARRPHLGMGLGMGLYQMPY